MPKVASASSVPLLTDRAARWLFVVVWVYLCVTQALQLRRIDHDFTLLGSHTEIDAFRAAEGYRDYGLTSLYGLPRILYGPHYDQLGTARDHIDKHRRVPEKFRRGFPPEMADADKWVNTHWPPGSDLILALLTRLMGTEPRWWLRLFPVAVGLISLASLFKAMTQAWGRPRAALVAAFLSALPMVSIWMPHLQYEGYVQSLLFVETALIIRFFGDSKSSGAKFYLAFFLIGFAQGYLSWDYVFVTVFLAVPWWLLKKAEALAPPWTAVVRIAMSAGTGFILAHGLHFLQIAGALHGWQIAWHELFHTGIERAGEGGGDISRITHLFDAAYLYCRWLFKPTSETSGPFFALVTLLSIFVAFGAELRLPCVAGSQGTRWKIHLTWPFRSSPLLCLGAAIAISSIWLVIMPQHSAGNAHNTVRHFMVFYLCASSILAMSFSRQTLAQPVCNKNA